MRLPLLALLAACATEPAAEPVAAPTAEPPPAAAPASTPSASESAARTLAATAADDLGKTLKSTLVREMKAGGPMAAIEVCTQQAGSLTRAVAERHGVRLGRSSLRLRNPTNSGPDWVRDWLAAADASGSAEPLLRTAETPEGMTVQHLRPLRIEAPCLACHGAAPAPEIRDHLAASYPEDRATGYALGDLRGALWVEVPVSSP